MSGDRFGAAVEEEIRVARLVAHMRPYLLSSAAVATQPMAPVQRSISDRYDDALRRGQETADTTRQRRRTQRTTSSLRRAR